MPLFCQWSRSFVSSLSCSRCVSITVMSAAIAHSGCHFQQLVVWSLVLLGLVCSALICAIVSVIVFVFSLVVVFVDFFDLLQDVSDCVLEVWFGFV